MNTIYDHAKNFLNYFSIDNVQKHGENLLQGKSVDKWHRENALMLHPDKTKFEDKDLASKWFNYATSLKNVFKEPNNENISQLKNHYDDFADKLGLKIYSQAPPSPVPAARPAEKSINKNEKKALEYLEKYLTHLSSNSRILKTTRAMHEGPLLDKKQRAVENAIYNLKNSNSTIKDITKTLKDNGVDIRSSTLQKGSALTTTGAALIQNLEKLAKNTPAPRPR